MVDLSKTIKINNHYEVSYGMILFTTLVTFFEILGIMCFNNWELTPAIFFLMSNAVLIIRKQAEDTGIEELKDIIFDLEEKIKLIEEKLN